MIELQWYFRFPREYLRFLETLRWSENGEAIEYCDGATFVFREELAQFLEGFVSQRSLVHFGLILLWLELLCGKKRAFSTQAIRLHEAFAKHGRAMRNAGALAGKLSAGIPEWPGLKDPLDMVKALRDPTYDAAYWNSLNYRARNRWTAVPLEPNQFFQMAETELARNSDGELAAALRHGRAPVTEAGKQLAERVPPPPPRSLGRTLQAMLDRPRLVGAQPYVAQMISALSLPPRRLAHQEFPIGGYADVIMRGTPEHLLPSQFALDDQDFYRRYAANELLYFRREEPHAKNKEEMVVLLDQGVRTWGDIRLVLSAAAVALGKHAERRGMAFTLASTGRDGEPLDPLTAKPEELADALESSDLSPHPADALTAVVKRPAELDRDIILLTQHRNLAESDVASAARLLDRRSRLFAVAMDEHGGVEMHEIRDAVPVRLRSFKVAFQPSKSIAHPAVEAEKPLGARSPWKGDIEPIPFPFCFGVETPIAANRFDFDADGEWLLTASKNGMLHAWKLDGSRMEVLPRAICKSTLLTNITGVLGVTNGFVVSAWRRQQVYSAYYNFRERTVSVSAVPEGIGSSAGHWIYARSHDAVLEPSLIDRSRGDTHVLSLPSSEWRWKSENDPGLKELREMLKQGKVPVRRVLVLDSNETVPAGMPALVLNSHTQFWELIRPGHEPHVLKPFSDGRPMRGSFQLLSAKTCGDVLAIHGILKGDNTINLYLLRLPEGRIITEYPSIRTSGFQLSQEGTRIARNIQTSQIEVREICGSAKPLLKSRMGGFAQKLQIRLGLDWIILWTAGGHSHILHWHHGKLEVKSGKPLLAVDKQLVNKEQGVYGSEHELADYVYYDRKRFKIAAKMKLIAVGDRYGQVAMLNHKSELVAMFFSLRDKLAGWLPDGTYFGPESLTGSAPTPGAMERFGKALRAASTAEGGGT